MSHSRVESVRQVEAGAGEVEKALSGERAYYIQVCTSSATGYKWAIVTMTWGESRCGARGELLTYTFTSIPDSMPWSRAT